MVMNSFGLPSGYHIRHGHNMEMSYTPGPSGFINAPLPQSGYQVPNVHMFQQNPINIGCQNSNVSGGNHFEILGNGSTLADYNQPMGCEDSAVPENNQPVGCEDHHLRLSN